MKILNKEEKLKKKRFEHIYKLYVNDVYRVSLYFLKEEKKARKITEQVFVDFYKELDRVDSTHIYGYLIHKAKKLSTNKQVHENAKEEVGGNE